MGNKQSNVGRVHPAQNFEKPVTNPENKPKNESRSDTKIVTIQPINDKDKKETDVNLNNRARQVKFNEEVIKIAYLSAK